MATDYDASRKTEDEQKEDSLEATSSPAQDASLFSTNLGGPHQTSIFVATAPERLGERIPPLRSSPSCTALSTPEENSGPGSVVSAGACW